MLTSIMGLVLGFNPSPGISFSRGELVFRSMPEEYLPSFNPSPGISFSRGRQLGAPGGEKLNVSIPLQGLASVGDRYKPVSAWEYYSFQSLSRD